MYLYTYKVHLPQMEASSVLFSIAKTMRTIRVALLLLAIFAFVQSSLRQVKHTHTAADATELNILFENEADLSIDFDWGDWAVDCTNFFQKNSFCIAAQNLNEHTRLATFSKLYLLHQQLKLSIAK